MNRITPYIKRGSVEKTAFDIGISPAAVIGSLTGAVVAGKKAEKDNANAVKNLMSYTPDIGSGYYKQVENLSNDLQIVFTPLGVIYVLKRGTTEIAVDNIDVNEMDSTMLERFRGQDRQFFKSIMMNKVMADVNLVERAFAQRFVQRNMDLGATADIPGSMKQAMVNEGTEFIKGMIEKIGSDSAYVNYLLDNLEDINVRVSVSDSLSEISKNAGLFGNPLEFLGIGKEPHSDLQGKMGDPAYLAKNAKVAFLPDRVMFIVNNMVVGQLSTIDMNEEGFKAFEDNDQNYFLDFFQGALGVSRGGIMNLLKRASDITDPSEIFYSARIHPEVYFIMLNSKLGSDWLTYDPEVLLKEIEEDFLLTKPIIDLVQNKIWMIQVANNPNSLIFKNPLAFEKAIRAMNDKPIDFIEQEPDISLGELIFALEVLENVTPVDDIYDNFSEAVLDYMVDLLSENNYRVIRPVASGENAAALFAYLDESVRAQIVDYITEGERDVRLVDSIRKEHAFMAKQAAMIIDAIRLESEPVKDIGEYAETYWDSIKNIEAGVEEGLSSIKQLVLYSVDDNISVDFYLNTMRDQLKDALAKFNQ